MAGIERRIEKLVPIMQRRVKAFLNQCAAENIKVAILETVRSEDIQKAYYAQGREHIEDVNELRRKAGLYEISEKENKNIITNCDGVTHKSNHQARADGYGYAVDIAPVDNKGRVLWNAPQSVWEHIGKIAEDCGLDWCAGGRGAIWGKGWDSPHFELPADDIFKD